MFMIVHRLFWHEHPGNVHVSMGAARIGGRDTEIGIMYHQREGVAVWMPPVAATLFRALCLLFLEHLIGDLGSKMLVIRTRTTV